MGLMNVLYKVLPTANFVVTGNGTAVDISASGNSGNGSQVAALQATIADITPANQTFNNGTSEVSTITFPTKAASTGGDYFVLFDISGNGWAAALNKSGSDPAPSGAVWTAIASGRKVNVDISGATTAANVAALVKTAFDALTSVPFSSVDPADGTLVFTCTLHGNTTNAARHNANDSGNGSISAATTTPGTATSVDVSANTVSITSHGFSTGLKAQLTTTGTLPAGLSTGTDYWIIAVDANTIAFGSSLVNAQAGTKIDITNQGSSGGVDTVSVTALSGTVNLQGSIDGTHYYDLASSQALASNTFIYTLQNASAPWPKYIALSITISAGTVSADQIVYGKGLV